MELSLALSSDRESPTFISSILPVLTVSPAFVCFLLDLFVLGFSVSSFLSPFG